MGKALRNSHKQDEKGSSGDTKGGDEEVMKGNLVLNGECFLRWQKTKTREDRKKGWLKQKRKKPNSSPQNKKAKRIPMENPKR